MVSVVICALVAINRTIFGIETYSSQIVGKIPQFYQSHHLWN